MTDYRERIADHQLRHTLARAGAVVIEGPKAYGKTETAFQCAQSVVEVDTAPNVAQLMGIAPQLILDGETPRLFDESHLQPALWHLVRRRVDKEKRRRRRDSSSSPDQRRRARISLDTAEPAVRPRPHVNDDLR